MRFIYLFLPVFIFANVCYSVDKRYLESNLDKNEDVLIELPNKLTKDFYIYLSFDTPRYIEYTSSVDFFCSENNNSYKCGADDDGGHLELKKDGKDLYIKLSYARMAETTDDPIIYYTKAKSNKFIKAKKSDCVKDLDAIVYAKANNIIEKRAIEALKRMQNIIIFSVSSYKNGLFAVGLDNSKETRKKQMLNEYYKFISLYSKDGGKSWEKSFNQDIPLYKVVSTGKTDAIAVGTIEGSGGYISTTKDSAKSWQVIYEGGFLNDIIKSGDKFIAVGFGILLSKDGKNWKNVLKLEDKTLNVVKAVSSDNIVAAGDSIIYVSNDGGNSWHKAHTKNAELVCCMDNIYIKDAKVYITARHPEGFKLVSKDNGESWHNVEFGK